MRLVLAAMVFLAAAGAILPAYANCLMQAHSTEMPMGSAVAAMPGEQHLAANMAGVPGDAGHHCACSDVSWGIIEAVSVSKPVKVAFVSLPGAHIQSHHGLIALRRADVLLPIMHMPPLAPSDTLVSLKILFRI